MNLAILSLIPQSVRAMVQSVLSAQRGAFVGFLWERALKTRKGVVGVVTKRVSTVAQVGVTHDNRRTVQAMRNTGDLPSVNKGLPWGKWLLFPYVIGHKGATYLRMEPIPRNKAVKVAYYLDGKMITRETAQTLCLASEFSKLDEFGGCITLKTSNLKRVKVTGKTATSETIEAIRRAANVRKSMGETVTA